MTMPATPRGPLARWKAIPLYLRIVVAMLLGVVLGLLLQAGTAVLEDGGTPAYPAIFRACNVAIQVLGAVSTLVLQFLGVVAPPLIVAAVIHVLMTAHIPGRKAARLVILLLFNTTVAILIGLGVANVLRPGEWGDDAKPTIAVGEGEKPDPKADSRAAARVEEKSDRQVDPISLVVDNAPRSLLGSLGDRPNIVGAIVVALAFGIAFRRARHRETMLRFVEGVYEALVTILHWIIEIVPLGVLAVVAKVIGTVGFQPFKALGGFVAAVLVALALHATWYLLRIRFGCWARPSVVLRGMRDALTMAFSTASSTATMPLTYECLHKRVGLREESASLGGLVGANFNNDGTALYEAMAALFVAQLVGIELSLWQQVLVVLTSILASVGAAGIPEAGLVTMTLVFTAVKLPLEYIGLLLTVDWFLDRCRTTINVLGDVNVSCLLDGRVRPVAEEDAPPPPVALVAEG